MPEPSSSFARENSPFLDGLITRNPQWIKDLESQGRLEKNLPPGAPALATLIDDHGLDTGLRMFRNREMMRIVWRELNQQATLTETMDDLSMLATLCLEAATQHHYKELSGRFGTPENSNGKAQELVIISLGKLGGFELNLSSDIDIVFAFPESGACNGRRGLSNEEFFTRQARKVVRSLSELNEHGFCFRVDTRLRPFGESGPLVCSFAAMEQYYQREGRDWERYALIKARPVAGDLPSGKALISSLKPFVYRRYIDFGAVEVLHDMYQSLREDSARRDRVNDVKRGPGGIREIEFLVQTFQLLRGGREPELQTTSLLTALFALEKLEILSADVVRSLEQNYRFLRRLENAIQSLHDQQTHSLPGGQDLERVARIMGFDDPEPLISTFEAGRESVFKTIRSCFPERSHSEQDGASPETWIDAKAGSWHPGEPLESLLISFVASLKRLSLSNRAAQRLDRFMPGLLSRLEASGFSSDVHKDVLNLVLAVCRRSAYLSLLVQNPSALDRMLSLFSQSDWVAQVVIRHPELLDELIDPSLGKLLPDEQEITLNARRIIESDQDSESVLLALNHMKLAFSLRIAVAELETTLSARQVQISLTRLAESIIQACYQLAMREVEIRHGKLPGNGIAIIAYGSLGAEELSYRSDLDLIFLYEHTGEASDGERPLEYERYHTTVVRRVLGFLTSTTTSGRLYEVDTRLRPNGRSGLLVSSLSAFEKYQKEAAWVWELQALSRARPCAGSKEIGNAFARLRTDILQQEREPDHIKDQVQKMRERLRKANKPGDGFKHGPGGLIDIDFVVQLGVLSIGPANPAVISASGTREQLQALQQAAWLAPEDFSLLDRAHDELTHDRHMSLISRQPVPVSAVCEESNVVCQTYLHKAGKIRQAFYPEKDP